MPSIFIAHSKKDQQFVERLVSDLKENGLDVWYDEWAIEVGDSLTEKIHEGIKESEYLAIIISPDSVRSRWVKQELKSALIKHIENEGGFIIPILLQKCEIPFSLKDLKYADFREDYQNGLEELLLKFKLLPNKAPYLTRTKYVQFLKETTEEIANIILIGLTGVIDRKFRSVDLEEIITEMEVNLVKSSFTSRSDSNWKTILNHFVKGRTGGLHFITGPAGIGKSTLLKYLYLKNSEYFIDEAILEDFQPIFPVFIYLKHIDMNFSFYSSIITFFKEYLHDAQKFLDYCGKKTLSSFIEKHRVVLYLDGVDEIRTSFLLKRFLGRLETTYNYLLREHLSDRVTIIITSRSEHMSMATEVIKKLPYDHYILEGFNYNHAFIYTKKWFENEKIEEIFANTTSKELTEELFRQINSDLVSYREIMSNPLLLTMLGSFYLTNRSLPESKFALLEYLPMYLCRIWDTSRDITTPYEQFSRFEEYFRFIAYENMKHTDISIDIAGKAFIEEKVKNNQMSRSEGEDLVRTLLEAIVYRPTIGNIHAKKFIFNLNVFQEYFAAERTFLLYSDESYTIDTLWDLIKPLFHADSQSPLIFLYKIQKLPKKYGILIDLFFNLLKRHTFDKNLYIVNHKSNNVSNLESFNRVMVNQLLYEDSKYYLPETQEKVLFQYGVLSTVLERSDKSRFSTSPCFNHLSQDSSLWINLFNSLTVSSVNEKKISLYLDKSLHQLQKQYHLWEIRPLSDPHFI